MIKKNLTKILAGLCICIAGVLFILGRSGAFSANASGELVIKSSQESNASTESEQTVATAATKEAASEELLFVHVCGAVRSPEVYSLPIGSRVSDAISAAGGFADDADTARLNLAEQLSDGMQIKVPTKTESASMESSEQATKSGIVNINTAGTDELMTLPGIGAAKAAAIISYREKNGKYNSPEDIMKVPGIKEAAYEQIRERISV